MKRILLVFVVLLILLAGCGDSKESEEKEVKDDQQKTQEKTETKEESGKTLVFPVSNFATEDPETLKKKFEDAGFEVNLEEEEVKKGETEWKEGDIFTIYAVNKNTDEMISIFNEGDEVSGDYVVTIIYFHIIDDAESTETTEESDNTASQDSQTESYDNTDSENPYIKLTKLEVRTETDYAHAFDDSIILGNGEGVTIQCTVSPATASEEDVLILYDDSEFDSVLQKSYKSGNNDMVYDFRVTGKKECQSYIYVVSTYDYIRDYENQLQNVDVYGVYIHKLNSSDGKIVYITPDGEKYHYSKNCAGANAYETTVYDAEAVELERCKKCS